MLSLNHTLDQMGLTDIYGAFYPTASGYTFFLTTCGTFSRVDHMITYKISLSTFKKFEMNPSNFCNNNAMKIGITNEENGKIHKYGK